MEDKPTLKTAARRVSAEIKEIALVALIFTVGAVISVPFFQSLLAAVATFIFAFIVVVIIFLVLFTSDAFTPDDTDDADASSP